VPSRGTSKFLELFTALTVPKSILSGRSCQTTDDS
jgi:hypothetical protein